MRLWEAATSGTPLMTRLTNTAASLPARALLAAAWIASLVLACSACSSAPETQTQADDIQRKAYRTGSNIPVRERDAAGDVRVIDPATVERTPVAPVR